MGDMHYDLVAFFVVKARLVFVSAIADNMSLFGDASLNCVITGFRTCISEIVLDVN